MLPEEEEEEEGAREEEEDGTPAPTDFLPEEVSPAPPPRLEEGGRDVARAEGVRSEADDEGEEEEDDAKPVAAAAILATRLLLDVEDKDNGDDATGVDADGLSFALPSPPFVSRE